MNISLLCRLREGNGGYFPLGALGDPIESVKQDLEELERFGFGLERHPYYGVAYREPAERLCPDQIEFELGTHWIGRRLAVWNRVTSTNDLAAQAACSAANEGLVILAEEQSAGRGRRGRTWTAPPRTCLLMSILLFPPPALAETPWLTALGAVAVAEVVADATGLDARIKWPNDVRVAGRKIAGVLVERGAGAVIGIGLNVNLASEDFPEALRGSATSLLALRGERADRSELARTLIGRLDFWYGLARARGAESLNEPWRAFSEYLGRPVRVTTSTGLEAGRLDDLDLDRGLALVTPDGARRWIDGRAVIELRLEDAPAARGG